MKKFAKSLLSFALVLILSIGSPILSFAEESSRGEPQWVEEKGQINFDNLTVSVSNRRTVDVQVDNTGNLFERIDGKKEKKKYDKLKKTHPEIASSIRYNWRRFSLLCWLYLCSFERGRWSIAKNRGITREFAVNGERS